MATLKAAGLAIVLSVVAGFLLAVARLSDHAWVRWPASLVIEFFRAVPVLLLIIFCLRSPDGSGMESETRGLVALVAALTLYNGRSWPRYSAPGSAPCPRVSPRRHMPSECARRQVMRNPDPQAVRFMLPAIISQCVVVLKDTSLGFLATYTELRARGKLAQYVGSSLMVYMLVALIYIAINNMVSALATYLERRLAARGFGSSEAAGAVEDVLPAGGAVPDAPIPGCCAGNDGSRLSRGRREAVLDAPHRGLAARRDPDAAVGAADVGLDGVDAQVGLVARSRGCSDPG